MKQWFSFLVGGTCVYFVVAACSATNSARHVARADAGTDATGGSAAAGGGSQLDANTDGAGGDTGVLDAIADAVTDPVQEAAATPYQSGSRLRARVLVATDGARQFNGWHDTQQNLDCSFVPAIDGTTRCLPIAIGIVMVFADANCSQPLVYGASACYVPSGVIGLPITTGSGCTIKTPYEALKVNNTVTQTTVYQMVGGTCSAATAPSTLTLYSATVVPPSQFVEATEQLE